MCPSLQALAPYLPRDNPQLSEMVYELVLNEFLQSDAEVCQLIFVHARGKLFSANLHSISMRYSHTVSE